jgi:hypothetical protein
MAHRIRCCIAKIALALILYPPCSRRCGFCSKQNQNKYSENFQFYHNRSLLNYSTIMHRQRNYRQAAAYFQAYFMPFSWMPFPFLTLTAFRPFLCPAKHGFPAFIGLVVDHSPAAFAMVVPLSSTQAMPLSPLVVTLPRDLPAIAPGDSNVVAINAILMVRRSFFMVIVRPIRSIR